LRTTVEQALVAAQRCVFNGTVQECATVAEGLCCPVILASPMSEATEAYKTALGAFRTANCDVNCPDILCNATPAGQCVIAGSNDTTGICIQN